MEFYDNLDKTIMCPKCKKFLTKVDSRDPRVHQKACKNCRKWIWYKATDDEYREIREIPPRTTSSGMTFY